MYLCDRDLEHAVERGHLIIDPKPAEYDTTGIDLHLDVVEEARVWDVASFEEEQRSSGSQQSVGVGQFQYKRFSKRYGQPLSTKRDPTNRSLVYREGDRVIVPPGGFFLWQTKEEAGTPEEDARYICFINGKSSIARMGWVVGESREAEEGTQESQAARQKANPHSG
jgi:deoxycytidine triphosphate deaminase